MKFIRFGLAFSGLHLFLVIALFLGFGLGLEGERNFGHYVLWTLLQPGASLPGPAVILLTFNSIIWGFFLALMLKIVKRETSEK